MALKKSARDLVAEANKKITSLTVEDAKAKLHDDEALFVDIRDVRELEREGMIPGAVHAPRGMLEFWIDPDSPYFKSVFDQAKLWILYCQSSWRSALAAAQLQEMGLKKICHIDGGFNAWKKAGGAVATQDRK